MADRGPQSDQARIAGPRDEQDPTYDDATFLGTDPDDSEEARDLGFIVEDHDDRRITLAGDWQRLDDLDTDEPLETNRNGPIPHRESLVERGAPEEWFATDYNIRNAAAEAQEADFVETSMLSTDPEMNDGEQDFTSDTMREMDGDLLSTDIAGNVIGPAAGLGTSLPQDLGSGGFQIKDNPLADGPRMPLLEGELSDYDDDGPAPQGDLDDIPVDLGASRDLPEAGDAR